VDPILDIFNSDAFSVVSLTDAINELPYIPGRIGAVVDWNDQQIATTNIAVEHKDGVLSIINPTARGGPGGDIPKIKRTLHDLRVPHYERDDAVMADEVQGVRIFGSGSQLQTVLDKINERMAQHTNDFDVTLEYQRLGAVKGIILNGDGSTLYNLFTEFAVTQQTEVGFNLGAASDGHVRKACTAVVRSIAKALKGATYRGVYAMCSPEFFDALIADPETRASYLQQQEAAQLRTGVAYQIFNFGGILFEDYRGGLSDGTNKEEGTNFIAADKCHIFPIGVAGLWKTVYAPADYNETVNTMGLPRYAKLYPMLNGKGMHLDMQSNVLNYCTRPRVLIQGKRQA
jgi:hypothetical protein